MPSLSSRIKGEQSHALKIINTKESNWGWHTSAGKIRRQRRLDFLLNGLSLNGIILEIGCGTGTFTKDLEKKIKYLIAMDISFNLIRIASSKTYQTSFLKMDAHNLSLKKKSIDSVIGCSILHHLDIQTALRSIFDILRPGGEIRFSEPNLLNPQIFLQKKIPFLKRLVGDSPAEYAFTKNDIEKILKNAGFINISVTPFEFLHPYTPAAFLNYLIKIETSLHKTFFNKFGGSLLIKANKPKE